jgi:hypothetical protein
VTSRSDNLKGSSVTRHNDKKQWSDVERVGFSLEAYGSGEHLMAEPVMFGRAFSRPPLFTYSLTAQNQTEVLPRACVPAENGNLNVDGIGWNSNSVGNQVIPDPWFEHQGMFVFRNPVATVIPTVSSLWDDEKPITTSWTAAGGGSTFPFYPSYPNNWCQGYDRRGAWVLSDDRSYSPGIGKGDSNWSAKFVLQNDGETNVLIPFQSYSWQSLVGGAATYGAWDVEGIASVIISGDFSWIWDTKGVTWSQPPPSMTGWDGYAHVWADAPGTLKVRAINFHHDNYGDIAAAAPDTETLPDRDDPSGYFSANVRYMNDLLQETTIEANKWNAIDVSMPMENSQRSWPNFPSPDPTQIVNSYWRFEYSFVGTAGTTVYLDGLHMWQTMKNGRPRVITIGVKEWLVDEAGAYIGAYLWFKGG